MKVYIGAYPGPKSKKKRIVDVRIDNYDTWSMDATLALIIVPMLKQLKKTMHGGPPVDDEDVPEEFRSTNAPPQENEDDVDAFFFKRWKWVLSEMIWAFEQCNKDWQNKFYSGKIDTRSVPVDSHGNEVDEKDAVWYKFVDGPKHTFKVDHEGMQKHEDRMKNGFRLFGRYYMNLWD